MAFQLVNLNEDNIDCVLGLQQVVYDDLPDSDKSFILPKTRGFFSNIFAQGSAMIGVRVNGVLVAQSIVLNPNNDHPDTGMVDMEVVGAPETISVLQGVLVHPQMRGKKLGAMMCAHWINACKENGRHNVLAETALPNLHSQSIFFTNNLPVVSLGVDPADGTVVCNHHADLKRPMADFNIAASGQVIVLMTDESKIRQVLADSFIIRGHAAHEGEQHFVFGK